MECSCLFSPGEDTVLKSHDKNCKSSAAVSATINSLQECDYSIKEDEILKETVVICGICANGFESEDECEKHIQSVHVHVSASKCFTCNYEVHSIAELERHVENEHGQPCSGCDSRECRCKTNVQCDDHLTNQHQQPYYSCGKCDYSFVTDEELEKHMGKVNEGNKCINCNQCEFKC